MQYNLTCAQNLRCSQLSVSHKNKWKLKKKKQRFDIKSNKWMKEIQCSTECIIMLQLNESHTWYDCWRMRSCDRDDDRTVWQNSERRCCSASSSLSYRTPHSPCLPQNYTVKRALNRAQHSRPTNPSSATDTDPWPSGPKVIATTERLKGIVY